MKQINYNSKEFNKLLNEYFQTNEFKKMDGLLVS